jgi:sortase A
VRRTLRILSVSLITTGVVILADVALTVAWEEPVSSVYASIEQREAEDELAELEASFVTHDDLAALGEVRGATAKARLLADRFAGRAEAGEGIGRVEIPSIGVDTVIVEGTDAAALRTGPGHYPDTAFPGQGETVGMAGHRTTYRAPFRRIDQLGDGDLISVDMPYATLTYAVEGVSVVEPSDVEIVGDVGRERLVLTACHPLYSAAQRIAVFARLSDVDLFAAGGRRWIDP